MLDLPSRFECVSEEATGPLATVVLGWLMAGLRSQGYGLPVCKRLAALVGGLLVASSASRGEVVAAISELHLSPATAESITRRVARILEDPRLDPARLLPDALAPVLPAVLAEKLAEIDAWEKAGQPWGAAPRPLRLIVDETTKTDQVHVLVVGLGYRGLVLPLAVRVWPQNVALAEGEYWRQLHGALHDVQKLLPTRLGRFLVVLADRAYGVARMVDLITSFGWFWLVRVQGQTRVRLHNRQEVMARTLVRQPGSWSSSLSADPLSVEETAPPPPLAAFKEAGWRACHVRAVWASEAAEPWLLLSNLPLSGTQYLEYANRWMIERLFLSWKSHGWDIEILRMKDPLPFGRLLSAMVIATWWTLAAAVGATTILRDDLDRRAQVRIQATRQLRLPLGTGPTRRSSPPWPAKFSLFTWGRHAIRATSVRWHSPVFRWRFVTWNAPPWSHECSTICSALC